MSIPFMLATGPLLGYYIGFWIDGLAGTGFVRFVMLALGFAAGIRSVIRVLNEETPKTAAFEASESREPDTTVESESSFGRSESSGDTFEEDGEIIGLVHYSRRKFPINKPAAATVAPDDGAAEGRITYSPDSSENVNTIVKSNNLAGTAALPDAASLLKLPVIVSVGMWTTLVASAAAALLGQREVAAGMVASGLWNLVNFSVLWMTFKLVFSSSPYRLFFTMPVLCIKIPLLYFLVVELFRLNLFDSLGLTLGLLVLPAVFLFLALLRGRA